MMFCLGVKLGLWHYVRNRDLGVLEQVSEENIWTEEMKRQEVREKCVMKSFITYTLR
jgi:hypothetical protein